MPFAKCEQAHADSGSPVLEANNVCAGGEKGMIKCFIIIAVFLVILDECISMSTHHKT